MGLLPLAREAPSTGLKSPLVMAPFSVSLHRAKSFTALPFGVKTQKPVIRTHLRPTLRKILSRNALEVHYYNGNTHCEVIEAWPRSKRRSFYGEFGSWRARSPAI